MSHHDTVLVLVCNGSTGKLIHLDRRKKSLQGDVIFARENQSSSEKLIDLIANDHHGAVKHGKDGQTTQGSLPSHNEEKERKIEAFIHECLTQGIDYHKTLKEAPKLVICVSVNHMHMVKALIEQHSHHDDIDLLGKDLVKLSLKALEAMLVHHKVIDAKKDKAA